MQIPIPIRETVDEFHDEWRHARLAPLAISEMYSLFPEESRSTPTTLNWPDNWPFAHQPGVYLVFGIGMQLLYVGKSRFLGQRLSNYFRWSAGPESPCRIVHTGWKTRPMFVATIAVAESFEAAALEEFLIARLHPEENFLLTAPPES